MNVYKVTWDIVIRLMLPVRQDGSFDMRINVFEPVTV